jgi:hypothetical protein
MSIALGDDPQRENTTGQPSSQNWSRDDGSTCCPSTTAARAWARTRIARKYLEMIDAYEPGDQRVTPDSSGAREDPDEKGRT